MQIKIFEIDGKLVVSNNGINKEFILDESILLSAAQSFRDWKESTNKFKESGIWNRNSYLENADIPTFSNVFYSLCFSLGTIPKPNQLFSEYFNSYCKDNGDGTFSFTVPITRGEHGKPLPKLDTLYIGALQHRITRCYASFIREVSALYSLICLSNDSKFMYDSEEDIHKDTDIIGIYKDKKYSISLYNRSKSSSVHRVEKEFVSAGKMENYFSKIKIEADVFNNVNVRFIEEIAVYNTSSLNKAVQIIESEKQGEFVI